MTGATERTLILVKPDGVRRGLVGEVVSRIEKKGYVISSMRMLNAERSMLEKPQAHGTPRGT